VTVALGGILITASPTWPGWRGGSTSTRCWESAPGPGSSRRCAECSR